MDLGIHPREHDLVVGTFGRSFYVFDDIRPLRELASKGAQEMNKTLKVYDAPNAFINQTQQASGTRFGGNAMFNGENRRSGAMISYSINKPESTNKKTSKKGDSITLKVYNSQNDLIRTIKRKAPKESGMHRTYWSLGEKGVRGPSRRARRKNLPEARGVTVLPGDYKVVMHYKGIKDSTTVTVAYDPRVKMPMTVLKSKYDLLKQLESKTGLAGKAVEQLKASKKIAQSYKKQLKAKKDSIYKEPIKATDSIVKAINVLIDGMIGKEDKRQGITRNPDPTPMTFVFTARRYIGSLLQKPGKTERQLMKTANEKLDAEMNKINAFYKTDWPTYRKQIETLNLSLFKDFKELKE